MHACAYISRCLIYFYIRPSLYLSLSLSLPIYLSLAMCTQAPADLYLAASVATAQERRKITQRVFFLRCRPCPLPGGYTLRLTP